MVRITIEVSEGYVRERANMENLQKLVDAGAIEPVTMLLDFMAFSHLSRKVEEGTTEFKITSENLKDEKIREGFNRLMTNAAALCILTNDYETKDK